VSATILDRTELIRDRIPEEEGMLLPESIVAQNTACIPLAGSTKKKFESSGKSFPV
jgi:hypothetical protein